MEASHGTFQPAMAGEPMVNGGSVSVPVQLSGSRLDEALDMPGLGPTHRPRRGHH